MLVENPYDARNHVAIALVAKIESLFRRMPALVPATTPEKWFNMTAIRSKPWSIG